MRELMRIFMAADNFIAGGEYDTGGVAAKPAFALAGLPVR